MLVDDCGCCVESHFSWFHLLVKLDFALTSLLSNLICQICPACLSAFSTFGSSARASWALHS